MTAPDGMDLFCNPRARRPPVVAPDTAWAAPDAVRTVRQFHRTLPAYRATPLVSLRSLARALGLDGIFLKDESGRFGLKAFKGLGASYAVCAALAGRLALPPPLDFTRLQKPDVRRAIGDITLVTASDGNHGTAVAWMAARLGCRSRIFLPAGTAACRLAAIRNTGGETLVVDGNYDDAVQQAARQARSAGRILVQDTTWEGYETIPKNVMQGYLTLFDEAFAQLGAPLATHVFVPCGVGSLAASLQAFLVEKFREQRPILVVVEAAAADCYYRSMAAGGRTIVPVRGPLKTRMAGLACGQPSPAAWDILRHFTDGFIRARDDIAIEGMQRLARPHPPDPSVESGECGAVTLGCLCRLMDPAHAADRHRLGLGPTSRILLFSTEGATDPESYRQAVHHRPAGPSAGG